MYSVEEVARISGLAAKVLEKSVSIQEYRQLTEKLISLCALWNTEWGLDSGHWYKVLIVSLHTEFQTSVSRLPW